MTVRKVITTLCIGLLASFFFYPVSFTFYPALNTKEMMAVLGLAVFVIRSVRGGERISRDAVVSTLIAAAFSLFCYFVEVHFDTDDGSYSTYIASFFVWLFGAYAVCFFLRLNHEVVSLRLITHYLGAVGVVQCLLSQLIRYSVVFQRIVDGIFVQGQEFLHEVNRLYGIGASLDSGGVRFAITLLLLAFFIVELGRERGHRLEFWLLILEFVGITVFGNMIARTTTVGAVLGLVYIAVELFIHNGVELKKSVIRSTASGLLVLAAAVLLVVGAYENSSDFNFQLRFAFEGFFNWVETGTFRTDSLDKMNSMMWIWPEDTKTWLIGSGKFDNWAYGTDIGYCRFVLYCGLIGFSIFALLFVYNAYVFSRKFDGVRMLSLFLLALSFAIWIKVSTDIFQIYALLICADAVVRNDKKIPEI